MIEQMEKQVQICVQEHIIERHMYKSLNDRRVYGASEGKYDSKGRVVIKSVFDDLWDVNEVKKHMIEMITMPSYIVLREEYVDEGRNTHNRFVFDKW